MAYQLDNQNNNNINTHNNHHHSNKVKNSSILSSSCPSSQSPSSSASSSSSSSSSSTSSLKTIYLKGKSPWGFRIIDLNHQTNFLRNNTQLVVSKVRSKSKAHIAGLKENDIILMINDISTHKLTLQEASDLIEKSENLCLVVISNYQKLRIERSESSERELKLNSIKLEKMLGIGVETKATTTTTTTTELSNNKSNDNSLSTNSSIGRTSKILYANPAFTKFIAPSNNSNNTSNNNNNNSLNLNSNSKTFLNSTNRSNSSSNNNYNTQFDSNSNFNESSLKEFTNSNYNNNCIELIDNNHNLRRDSNNSVLNYDNPNSNSSIVSSSGAKSSSYKVNTSSSMASSSNAATTNQNRNQKFRNNNSIYSSNNNYYLRRNYHSATESNGEDEFDSKPYLNHRLSKNNYNNNNLSKINNNNNNNNNVEEKNRVSYASITLRQPLKDLNYFSDTEAFNTSAPKYKLRNLSNSSSSSSNYNRINKNLTFLNSNAATTTTTSNSLNQHLRLNSLQNTNNNNNYNNNNNQQSLLIFHNNNKSNTNKLSEPDYLTKKTLNSSSSLSFDYSNQLNLHDLNNYSNNTYNNSYFINNNKNKNSNINNNNNNNQSILSTVPSKAAMYNQANVTNFNRQPHGFSKLSGFYNNQPIHHVSSPQPYHSIQQQQQQQQFQPNQTQQQQIYQNQFQRPTSPHTPNYLNQFNNKPNNTWVPSMVQPPAQRKSSTKADEALENPIAEKYEREMGSELAKPTSKTNYSDSYFYNSTVFNYPTIDDQKKLAKSIAETLEGSNPSSKYHKKKQNIQNQLNRDGNESDPQYSHPYYSTGNEYSTGNDEYTEKGEQLTPLVQNSFVYDESLPDIIKRSIAQASMTDPVRSVQAPENTKQLHYTEHTTHTQMPPKAAMSLAAALENEQFKGGKGAQIFQKRKAKSEKWIVDETNVKKVPGQIYQPPPPPQPQQQAQLSYAQQEVFEPRIENEYKLEQYSNQQNNSKFSDFNAKPRGWGNSDSLIKPVKLAIDNLAHEIAAHEHHHHHEAPANIEHHPNRIDLAAWNNQKNQQQQQSSPNTNQYNVSKDGVQHLKAKFYESARASDQLTKPMLISNIQPANNGAKIRSTKLSSHENYLFNNKNSQNALKVSLNSYQHQQQQQQHDYAESISSFNDNASYRNANYSNYEDEIAASDL